jgi:hypothetical protein
MNKSETHTKKYRKGPKLPRCEQRIRRAEMRFYAYRLWLKGHTAGYIVHKLKQKWPGVQVTDGDVLTLMDKHWSIDIDLYPGEK